VTEVRQRGLEVKRHRVVDDGRDAASVEVFDQRSPALGRHLDDELIPDAGVVVRGKDDG
jgi:hypothetical protein